MYPRSHVVLPLGLADGPVHTKYHRIFSYGNFETYYDPKVGIDPRIHFIRTAHPELKFEGSNILDVGCNSGLLTFTMAAVFRPNRVTAVDVDVRLIDTALAVLRAFKAFVSPPESSAEVAAVPSMDDSKAEHSKDGGIQNEETRKESMDADDKREWLLKYLEKNERHWKGPTKVMKALPNEVLIALVPEDPNKEDEKQQFPPFPHNVEFRPENFVTSDVEPRRAQSRPSMRHDIVICFGVTKWVHLHWGDEGIPRLFKNIAICTKPGGSFLVEWQDWNSYKKTRLLTDEMKEKRKSIELRPERDFERILSEVGFETSSLIHVEAQETDKSPSGECGEEVAATDEESEEAPGVGHKRGARPVRVFKRQ